MTFTLTAINLNAPSAKPIVISGIKDKHYIFTVENSKCDVYSFQVAAMAADVSSSDPSAEIARSIPSLPDIALIGNAVQYSLTKSANNVFKFNVKLQVTTITNIPVFINEILFLEYCHVSRYSSE